MIMLVHILIEKSICIDFQDLLPIGWKVFRLKGTPLLIRNKIPARFIYKNPFNNLYMLLQSNRVAKVILQASKNIKPSSLSAEIITNSKILRSACNNTFILPILKNPLHFKMKITTFKIWPRDQKIWPMVCGRSIFW
jgi:hypothetical protein